MKKLFKVLAGALALTIATLPAIASADTTVDVTKAGAPVTAIASGDTIRVSSGAPIASAGAISQILAAVWSKESLQLTDLNSIVLPEGWTLEYTTDSETWSATAPADLTTVTGIRAVGDIQSDGNNTFETKASSQLVVTQENFQGSGGGDGFGVTFAGNRVVNIFHHDAQIRIDCHYKSTGAACDEGLTVFDGYTTGRYSEAFWDGPRSILWVQARQSSSGESGFACVKYGSGAPQLCDTPFVGLDTTRTAYDLETPAKIGSKIYQVNKSNWKITCFDIATKAKCANSGFALPNNGVPANDYYEGRVATAGDGKVYWTTTGKLGCYNPATNDLCGAAINLSSNDPQFPMIPIRNAAGNLLGMCVFHTQQCIDGSGSSVDVIPAALKTWMNAHRIPEWNTSDAGAYAEQNNKIYLPVGPSGSAEPDVYCFSFTTGAACDGFSGVNVGAEIYAIIADPAIPNCLWTNGNQGKITTFDGRTGLAGCKLDYPVVEMPYSAVAPRLACNEDGRVLTWESIKFAALSGIDATDLKVTILDSDGVPISGWVDISPNSSGLLSMNSLTVEKTGTKPSIRVSAGAVDADLLSQLTAVVKFEAEEPQLCFDLTAAPACPDFTPAPGDLSVPDGLIQTAAITTSPDGEALEAGDTETVLEGTNTGGVCEATLTKLALPTIQSDDLADTGGNSGLMLMAVFAMLMAAGGILLVKQARR